MANTVTTYRTFKTTLIPQTGSDVTGFTFDQKTYKAYLLADNGATVNMYFAGASSGNAGFTVPAAPNPPLIIDERNIQGGIVTFNGTNAKNLQILEFMNAST